MFELTRAEHSVDNSSTCHLWIQRKNDPKFASLKILFAGRARHECPRTSLNNLKLPNQTRLKIQQENSRLLQSPFYGSDIPASTSPTRPLAFSTSFRFLSSSTGIFCDNLFLSLNTKFLWTKEVDMKTAEGDELRCKFVANWIQTSNAFSSVMLSPSFCCKLSARALPSASDLFSCLIDRATGWLWTWFHFFSGLPPSNAIREEKFKWKAFPSTPYQSNLIDFIISN